MIRVLGVICFIIIGVYSDHFGPLMLQQNSQLLEAIAKTNMGVFFYGNQNSQQYQAYEQMIPSSRQIFNGLQFYYIPSDRFKLPHYIPFMTLYRNLTQEKWLNYRDAYDPKKMEKWIKHNCFDELQEFHLGNIDQFVNGKKNGYILIDYAEFNLIRTKIRVKQICDRQQLQCGKISASNAAIEIAIRLLRAEKQIGISKLGYWDSQSEQLQIYTGKIDSITIDQLIGLQEGRQGIILADNAQFDEGIFIDQMMDL